MLDENILYELLEWIMGNVVFRQTTKAQLLTMKGRERGGKVKVKWGRNSMKNADSVWWLEA